MNTLKLAKHITIPEDEWEPNDGLDDPRNCLYHTLVINGLYMHLEAWEVRYDERGWQVPVASEYEEDYERLHAAVNGDGAFSTVEIAGREYILIATPHC